MEAGIGAEPYYSTRYYYFEDKDTTNGYNHNFLAYVPSSELGYKLDVFIWKNTSSWSIELTSSRSGGYHWAGYSTPNYMSGSKIYTGTQYYGTTGTSSPLVHYINNYYKTSDGVWRSQFRPDPAPGDYDSPTQSGVITCSWATKPSADPSGNGGDWKVSAP